METPLFKKEIYWMMVMVPDSYEHHIFNLA